jgi:hypothetical protein
MSSKTDTLKSQFDSATEFINQRAGRKPGPGGRRQLFRDASRLNIKESLIDKLRSQDFRMDVFVGIQAEDNERSGRNGDSEYSNAQLLYLLSRGSRLADIPPRPLIEPALKAHHNEISKMLGVALKHSQNGNSKALNNQLEKIGKFAVSAINDWFYDARNGWAPNSPSTIRSKGSDVPLIDTSEMKDAISYRVIKHRGSNK